MRSQGLSRVPSVQFRSGGLYAALLTLSALALLLPFQSMSAQHGTYTIGFGAIIAAGAALFLKFRHRWRLNAEIVFLAGISLQYLITPTVFRLVTNNFEDLAHQITNERWEVKDGYPGAMLVVLCFIAVFLTTSWLLQLRRGHPNPSESSSLSSASIPFAAVLVAALWITRIILLQTGSYYHMNRTEFQVEDSRYSMLAQLDFVLGTLVASYAFRLYLIRKRAVLLPVALYLLLDFAWNFSSGSRERTLIVVICLTVTYVVCTNRVPLKLIALGGVLGLFLIGFMDYYRYAVATSTDASKLELSVIGQALNSARDTSRDRGIENTVFVGLSRLNDLDSIAAIYLWVPSTVEFLHGETYERVLAAVVPRLFWPEKPPSIMPINSWFFTAEVGSSPTTTMGEGYLNFGWWGVVLSGVFSAVFLRFTENFLFRYCRSSFFVPVYVMFLLTSSRLHTQPASIWLCVAIKFCLLMWISNVAIRVLERMISGSPPRLAGTSSAKPQVI